MSYLKCIMSSIIEEIQNKQVNRTVRFVLIILVGGLLVFGCSSEDQTVKDNDLEPLILKKDLSISAENQEALIGDFSGLAVDEEGIIYAADSQLQKIHLFSPNGDYLDSLGQKGKGPGEFIRLDPKIRILSNTLYVKDNNSKRINLFSLNSRQPAGTINIPNAKIEGVPMGYLRDMFPLSDGNILVSFMNTYFSVPEEEDPPHKTTISLIDKSGKFIKQNLLQFPVLFPTDQRLIYFESESMTVFTDVSFYPDTKMAIDPEGYLYVGSSDSLLLFRYDEHGEPAGVVQGNYQPASLTESDIDSLLEDREVIFKKAVNDAGLPDYWPSFQDFLIDDAGRCWIQLLNPGKPEQTWWVFDTDGKPKWKFKLSTEIKLHVVKNGKAYGIFHPREGLPSIVIYSYRQIQEI